MSGTEPSRVKATEDRIIIAAREYALALTGCYMDKGSVVRCGGADAASVKEQAAHKVLSACSDITMDLLADYIAEVAS